MSVGQIRGIFLGMILALNQLIRLNVGFAVVVVMQ